MYSSRKIYEESASIGLKAKVRESLLDPIAGFTIHLSRDILTRNSFLNAIVIVNVLGGSTNAVRQTSFTSYVLIFPQVLHLLAMARAADIELTIDDFQMIADKTPFLADLM